MEAEETFEQAVQEFLSMRAVNPDLTPEEFCREKPDFLDGLVRVLQLLTTGDRATNTFSKPVLVSVANRRSGEHPAVPEKLGVYAIRKKIGQGGMGAVYLAVDTQLDRLVAIKVMRPDIASQPLSRARFLREAKAMAALKHEHIATIHAANEESTGITWLAMELLEGQTLNDALKANRPFDWKDIIRISREIALGLSAAHAKKLIHRDIKPANIWLEAPRGKVKLLDFGLARLTEGEHELTGSGALLGTPAFMAPEQARGEAVDHRCDLFSLGALMYRVSTGTLPFSGATMMATLTALATREPTPVKILRPDCPDGLAGLIHRLLAKDRDQRPDSVAAVADALANLERNDFPGHGSVSPFADFNQLSAWGREGAESSRETNTGASSTKVPLDPTVAPVAPSPAKSGRSGRNLIVLAALLLLAGGTGFLADKMLNKGGSPTAADKPITGAPGEERVFEIAKGVNMKFCWIPAGKATLGFPADELEKFNGVSEHSFETPGFWIGKHEVTQEEYLAVTGTNQSWHPGAKLPVQSVSWVDCRKFVEKCDLKGLIARLPHEDEWEYACRGGQTNYQAFYWGNQEAPDKANYGNIPAVLETPPEAVIIPPLPMEEEMDIPRKPVPRPFPAGPGVTVTPAEPKAAVKVEPKAMPVVTPAPAVPKAMPVVVTPVPEAVPPKPKKHSAFGEKPTVVGRFATVAPHPWGLCDMHGNLWEICDNFYDPEDGDIVIRGGGWSNAPHCSQSAFRGRFNPADRSDDLGFRIVLIPQGGNE